MIKIAEQLARIHERIAEYEQKYHRQKSSVRLLAVSKNQSIENIAAAFIAGQKCFGESYLQEALPKIAALPGIEWHYIGPLQSNKTRKIAACFAWVHSLDSEKMAKRLSEQRPDHLPPLNICIQVNVSEEEAKSGVKIEEAEALAHYCLDLPRLHLRGLMTIPAPAHDFQKQREAFHPLAVLYHHLCERDYALDILSMGMSNDFEAAIAEGANLVRIGSAIWKA